MSKTLLAGILTPEGHVLTQRIYYEDTDFSGVVYHARYLHFMERGRTDFLRCLGVEQAKLHAAEGEGMAFVVHRMEIDFKSSARMDDVIDVFTRSERAAGAKLVLAQEIRVGERPVVAARVTIAVVNRSGRPRRLPADLAEKFG
jgi:acyl-CoA thioester hydrolase